MQAGGLLGGSQGETQTRKGETSEDNEAVRRHDFRPEGVPLGPELRCPGRPDGECDDGETPLLLPFPNILLAPAPPPDIRPPPLPPPPDMRPPPPPPDILPRPAATGVRPAAPLSGWRIQRLLVNCLRTWKRRLPSSLTGEEGCPKGSLLALAVEDAAERSSTKGGSQPSGGTMQTTPVRSPRCLMDSMYAIGSANCSFVG